MQFLADNTVRVITYILTRDVIFHVIIDLAIECPTTTSKEPKITIKWLIKYLNDCVQGIRQMREGCHLSSTQRPDSSNEASRRFNHANFKSLSLFISLEIDCFHSL